MLTPKIPIAREGYPFVWFSAFCTLIFAVLDLYLLALVLVVITGFILAFFRDPERFVDSGDDTVVAPADGRIIVVETVEYNTFTEARAKKISIFMNVFNVHVNRLPCSGIVERISYQPGKFYAADSDKAALENEYCAVILQKSEDQRLAVVQMAGLIARRIVCWLEPGDLVDKGRRFGLIRFGSRVDLYLPEKTEIIVTNGQKVRAGETVLGRFVVAPSEQEMAE